MAARRAALALVGLAGAVGLLAACTSEEDTAGYGHVEVADLPDGGAGHFTATPRSVTARLVLHDNGCVNVLLDGVERHPVWPVGTSVADQGDGRYLVTLSTGVALEAGPAEGDSFTAMGSIDDAAVPLVDADAQGKVGSFLAYCRAPGEPVAFADADTNTRLGS